MGFLVLSWLCLGAGCAPPAMESSRDATGAVTLHCNRSSLRWNACYDAAANLCGPKGYQIVKAGDGGAPSVSVNPNEVLVIGEAMVIRCNQ